MNTKFVCGIHLPEDDDHFHIHLEKGQKFKGRGTYQFSKIMAALPLVKTRDVAVDVGGHVGLWSMVLAEYFGQVLAFEPVPSHIDCFKKNMEQKTGERFQYNLRNVTLHQCALGAMPGETYIESVVGNSGNAHVSPSGQGHKVKVETLDDMLKGYPQVNFIKIDVEGFEQAVVLGGELSIKRYKPVMVVEQKPGHAESQGYRTGSVIDILKGWGYKELWVRSGDHCLVWNK